MSIKMPIVLPIGTKLVATEDAANFNICKPGTVVEYVGMVEDEYSEDLEDYDSDLPDIRCTVLRFFDTYALEGFKAGRYSAYIRNFVKSTPSFYEIIIPESACSNSFVLMNDEENSSKYHIRTNIKHKGILLFGKQVDILHKSGDLLCVQFKEDIKGGSGDGEGIPGRCLMVRKMDVGV